MPPAMKPANPTNSDQPGPAPRTSSIEKIRTTKNAENPLAAPITPRANFHGAFAALRLSSMSATTPASAAPPSVAISDRYDIAVMSPGTSSPASPQPRDSQ